MMGVIKNGKINLNQMMIYKKKIFKKKEIYEKIWIKNNIEHFTLKKNKLIYKIL